MTGHRSRLRAAIAGALLVGAVTLAASCGGGDSGDSAFAGYERTPTPHVGDLTLPAVEADGTETDLAMKAAEGKVMLVYFGYTNCPDVCPTTLFDIKKARRTLGADGDKVNVAFATVDPKRDTAEVMAAFRQAVKPAYDKAREKYGADVDKVLAEAETIRKTTK